MRARWLGIVLAASVALNLFFLGFYSARALQHHDTRARWAEHAPGGPARPGAPGTRRGWRPRAFEWMSDAERAELRPRRKAIRNARRAAEEALRAEPFDAEKLRQALGDLRRETDGIQATVHDSLLKRSASMSGEERRRLADANWGAQRGAERDSERGAEQGPERRPERGPEPSRR